MDLQKEREAFKAWFKKGYLGIDNLANRGDEGAIARRDYAYTGWQAAKAQAVPDGFALVSQKDLLELTIAINAVDLATHTESKTNEVREMWQQVALKLMALGAAQEPK